MGAGNQKRSHQRDPRDGVGQRHQWRVHQLGHAPDDLEPQEGGQHEDVQSDLEVGGSQVATCSGSEGSGARPNASLTRGWTTWPPRETNVSRVISSSRSIRSSPSLTRWARKADIFFAYIWLA